MSLPVPVQPGEIVAEKYRVERVLGEGGMGVVVAATHVQIGQRVALKFLVAEATAEVRERFLREARAAARIHSEHVTRVLDVGTLPTGAPYMVMEFLDGEDLEHRIAKGGPLSDSDAAAYVLEALEAVAEAHAAGMVHRDLKPANLFVAQTPTGESIKVLDFGISKAPLHETNTKLTAEAAIMGTPAYMSPEQVRESAKVDARADLWSMGVVLHELVTGTLPFTGTSFAALVASILTSEPLRAERGGKRSALQPVIDRCLQRDPAARFVDAADLARALAPFAGGRSALSLQRIESVLRRGRTAGVSPAVAPPWSVATVAVTTGGPTLAPTSTQPGTPPVRRSVLPVALASLLLGGGIAAGAARFFGSPPPRKPTTTELRVTATVDAPPAPTASPAPIVTTEPSAAPAPPPTSGPAPSATASPIARTVASPRDPRPVRSVAPVAAPPPAATAAPKCKLVNYLGADGYPRVRQVCP